MRRIRIKSRHMRDRQSRISHARKGSITVFLSLMAGVFLMLLMAGLTHVRTAASRTQILCAMDIGLYSLFAQYDRQLFREYDLLAVDGTWGGQELNLAAVWQELLTWMKPVLAENRNTLQLSLVTGGFAGYQLITDQGYAPFLHQACLYAGQPRSFRELFRISALQERGGQVRNQLASGEALESEDLFTAYEEVLYEALMASQSLNDPGELTGQAETFLYAGNGADPVAEIRRRWELDPLERTLTGEVFLAGGTFAGLLSERGALQGFGMESLPYSLPLDLKSRLLCYWSGHLGCYTDKEHHLPVCQLEYMAIGKDSDRENLEGVLSLLLMIRLGAAFEEEDVMEEAGKMAEEIAAGYPVRPDPDVLYRAVRYALACDRSIREVQRLLAGEAVDGLYYKDYLLILLDQKDAEEAAAAGLDMIELSVRRRGRPGFMLDACITAAAFSADVTANRTKTFTVTKGVFPYDS